MDFNAWLQELKAKISIRDVVASYVALEKKGGRFWACCPFHHEKTPSFALDEVKNIYHCFGCGKGGDAISFVMDADSVSFMDAVKILADRYKMELPDFKRDKTAPDAKAKRERLYALTKAAARHYHDNLRGGKADAVKKYITDRGVSESVQKRFGMGASLGYNELVSYLRDKGFSAEEMIDAGVCETSRREGAREDGGIYDALHGRLIVPIIDIRGNVIAFGGRVTEPTDFAKYKNTKETAIFEKNKELFGAYALKRLKLREQIGEVILVEGYMDVIALAAHGIENVVASMGTSLTSEQARLIKRFSDNVVLTYDGDGAGQKATERGVGLLRDAGLMVKAIALPEGLDPDDYIKKNGAGAFLELKKNALPMTEFLIRHAATKHDRGNPDELAVFLNEAFAVLSELRTETEREVFFPLVKELSGVAADRLRLLFSRHEAHGDAFLRDTNDKRAPENAYFKAVRFILYSLLTGSEYAREAPDISAFLREPEHSAIYDLARGGGDLDGLRAMDGAECEAVLKVAGMDKDTAAKYFSDSLAYVKKSFRDEREQELSLEYDECLSTERKREILVELQSLKQI